MSSQRASPVLNLPRGLRDIIYSYLFPSTDYRREGYTHLCDTHLCDTLSKGAITQSCQLLTAETLARYHAALRAFFHSNAFYLEADIRTYKTADLPFPTFTGPRHLMLNLWFRETDFRYTDFQMTCFTRDTYYNSASGSRALGTSFRRLENSILVIESFYIIYSDDAKKLLDLASERGPGSVLLEDGSLNAAALVEMAKEIMR